MTALHRPILVTVTVALAASAGACRRAQPADAADSSAATVSATVTTITARPFVETVGGFGSVAARAGHIVVLSAPASMRVSSIGVSIGDQVGAGTALVGLDAVAAKAASASADAAVVQARAARERAARLVSQGIAARRDLEQADADLARAQSDSVAAARVVALATIRSPIAGVVSAVNARVGEFVDATTPLVEVADPSALDVVVLLSPDAAARARSGARVAFSTSLASTSVVAEGTVVGISPAIDSATRQVEVRVSVNTSARPLRLGESLYATITVGTLAHAVVVPVAALVPVDDGFRVYVVDDSGVAHGRVVRVGTRADSVAEILQGLVAGERVVTVGAFGVEDGAKIVTAKR